MRMLDKILDSYWTNVTLGCWGIKWVWEVSWAVINWKSKDHLKACVGGVRSWPKGVRLAIMRPAGLTLVNMSAIHLHKLPTPPTHFLPHWSSVVTPPPTIILCRISKLVPILFMSSCFSLLCPDFSTPPFRLPTHQRLTQSNLSKNIFWVLKLKNFLAINYFNYCRQN